MREFHLAAQILKPPDHAGDGVRPVQSVELIWAQVFAGERLAGLRPYTSVK
jgi:hypothetical protein